ncbi:hypothetical protein ACIBCM_30555 [Streptomyces sp. NPDC051018]|uniref:DUF7691 family protein n=1 Tax=Streptomyces sp. NPDC051018 TaxID=3365639 RepID=UPI00379E6F82
MSHNISSSTADKAKILAYLGSKGDLSPDQQRRLAVIREAAQGHQDDLDRQGVDWGLSLPDALDHLLAGHTGSDADCAGNAYHSALQHIIDHNGSDPDHLGTYSRPSTFFSLVDEALHGLGVPADLLPHAYLYGGPPSDFPLLPASVDGYPAIGHLPLAKAKPAADAYRAVLDHLDDDFLYEVQQLIEVLDIWHEGWEYSTANVAWYTQDTLFFRLV